MDWKGKVTLAAGVVIMAVAVLLKLFSALSLEQFVTLLLIGFIVLMHPLDYRKRAMLARDEFIRRVNLNSMAYSWRATQYLVVALLFATVLHWIAWSAVWVLIIVSVFMTLTYILFMIPMFQKGDVK